MPEGRGRYSALAAAGEERRALALAASRLTDRHEPAGSVDHIAFTLLVAAFNVRTEA